MKAWKWKAVNAEGKIINGIWEDEDESLILIRLRKLNLFPLKITKSYFHFLPNLPGDNKLYWSRISRKIATMLEAGVPLLTVLEIITQREKDRQKKKQWENVCLLVQAGEELSEAFKNFMPSPGQFVLAMIRAGEKSGTLVESFLSIADELEEQYYFKQKLRTSLFYPFILLLSAFFVLYVLSIIVMPMYESLFAGLDEELPVITKAVFAIGRIIPYILFFTVIAVFVVLFLERRYRQNSLLQHLLLYFPLFGSISKYNDLFHFCSLFGRLLDAGICLNESLRLLAGIAKSKEMKKIAENLIFALNQGRRLSPVFLSSNYFPAEAGEMLAVAEEAGRLNIMFIHLSRMFGRELEEKLQQLVRLLEPLLIIGMAGLVGLVAVGVLLPIFDVSTHIR